MRKFARNACFSVFAFVVGQTCIGCSDKQVEGTNMSIEVSVLSTEMISANEFLYDDDIYSLENAHKLFVGLGGNVSEKTLIIRLPQDTSLDAGLEYQEYFKSIGFNKVRVGVIDEGSKS